VTPRQQRALRGAVAAAVATLLAAVSHTIAGGPAPAPLLVALMIALCTPVAGGLVGPRPSLPRLAAAVAASQGAFHAVFQALGSPTGDRIATASGGHDHAGAHGAVQTALLAPAAPEATAMPLAHAIAAALTIALLWRGERIVRAIARQTLAVLRRARAPRAAFGIAVRAPWIAPAAPRRRPLPLSSVSRRGPPVPLGA
jgi:hypothetical protein